MRLLKRGPGPEGGGPSPLAGRAPQLLRNPVWFCRQRLANKVCLETGSRGAGAGPAAGERVSGVGAGASVGQASSGHQDGLPGASMLQRGTLRARDIGYPKRASPPPPAQSFPAALPPEPPRTPRCHSSRQSCSSLPALIATASVSPSVKRGQTHVLQGHYDPSIRQMWVSGLAHGLAHSRYSETLGPFSLTVCAGPALQPGGAGCLRSKCPPHHQRLGILNHLASCGPPGPSGSPHAFVY